MNEFWKKPARLWRRSSDGAPSGASAITQLDSGSLEEMIRAAIETDHRHSAGQASLFVDVEAEQMLSLSEIKQLRRAPDFPVDI